METIQTGIVALLRSAVTGESLPLPEEFSLEGAMPLIRSHGIASLIYVGAANCGLSPADPVMQQLFRSYCLLLRQSEGQLRDLKALFARFEEAGIDYMPLKGTNLKSLYPKPELRPMGDADVLIRMEQYDRIPAVMESLGFQFKVESDHELIWHTPNLYLELHKRLIPSYNDKFHAYFGDGWTLARPRGGSRYGMDQEDEFVYLFTHFTKHYRDGGIGLRHVMDLWVYLRSHPDLDREKLSRELDKLGLLEFYGNLTRLMDHWFCGGPGDERTEFLGSYIFASGSWGRMDQRALSAALRGQSEANSAGESRLRYLWKLMFPAREKLLTPYPVLGEHPWLLPFVWVWRLVEKAVTGRVQLSKRREDLALRSQENLDRQRSMLDYVGLRDRY